MGGVCEEVEKVLGGEGWLDLIDVEESICMVEGVGEVLDLGIKGAFMNLDDTNCMEMID